jgi:ribonuclease J
MHLINDLLRLGVTVKSKITDPEVHTSGHAGRSEQRHMIELVRPRSFIPLHGTLHHLRRHEELARHAGVERTLVIENGTPALCDGASLRRDEEVAHGVVHVAYGGEPLEPATKNTRAELGRYGIVFVSAALDRGKLLGPPAIVARGVPRDDDNDAAARALGLELARALETFRPGRGLEREEWARRAIRRKLEELSGTRPNVELRLITLD